MSDWQSDKPWPPQDQATGAQPAVQDEPLATHQASPVVRPPIGDLLSDQQRTQIKRVGKLSRRTSLAIVAVASYASF